MIRNAISVILTVIFVTTTIFSNVVIAAGGTNMKKAEKTTSITVGKSDKYDFKSVQDAVNSIKEEPNKNFPAIIRIYKGVYEETVNIDIPYVYLINAESKNPDDVIITYDKATNHIDSSKSFGTQKTATVTLGEKAIGFNAENITFQNSYNLNGDKEQTQAVALVSLADKVIFNNCKFLGRQDTLYLKGSSKGEDIYGSANNARVYFKNCYIEGTVDYVFGDATAYFDRCILNLAYYKNGGHFTAANTTLFNIGYVFNECELKVDKKYTEEFKNKIDLGRPWQSDDKYINYGAHTVYINCKMPAILKDDGFSVWDDATVRNKVRYMEYNKKMDLSKRAEWVKILNDEQVQAYSVYNVLSGSDRWNPTEVSSEKIKVADITLNKYYTEIPKGESEVLKAFVLPQTAANKNYTWLSSNSSIASVDKSGKITALKEGEVNITAITEDGSFSVYAIVKVVSAKTAVPEVENISINSKENIYPNDTLKAVYNYLLLSDNQVDNATVKWYAVDENNNEQILLKEGKTLKDREYNVSNADIGYKIKIEVIPETLTTYGTKGKPISSITSVAVSKSKDSIQKVYLREGFENFYETKYKDVNNATYPTEQNHNPIWIGNDWTIVDNDGNPTISSNNDGTKASFIEYNPGEYNYTWGDINVTTRMRFNPLSTGLSSDCYYDLYTAYNGKGKSYYKLRIVRGGTTKSLKLYLYKKANSNSKEILIASDEKTLSNNVYQNSKDENPWFNISQYIDNGNIKITFNLEEGNKTLATITAKDEQPLDSGFIAFESFGKNATLLLSSVCVQEILHNTNNQDKTRIYLAGDSTVKSYGDDNTIGGWGEYLPYYFDSDKVEIINKAEGGRSTRSYINEGRLDEIISEIRKGDYLFIQFGHNDALTTENARVQHSVALGEPDQNGKYPTVVSVKTSTPTWIYDSYKTTQFPYKETFYPYESGTYKWFLEQYVLKAREKGAIPVLITPVARVFFNSEGKITPHHGENDGYVEAVLQVAKELKVAYVNMFDITKDMYENYGFKVTQGLQNIKSDGSMDITHYNKFGSNIVTSLLIKALEEQHIAIAMDTIASSKFVSKTDDLKTANLFIVGDSTVNADEYDDSYSVSKHGWGNYIQNYFVDSINITNLALENQSSKSFIKEKNYNILLNNIQEGDYVIIHFGNEDANNSDYDSNINLYTDAKGDIENKNSFKYYLYNYYIKPIQDKKAIPLLTTPAENNYIDNSSYVTAIKELAVDKQLYYLDLNGASKNYYSEIGNDNVNGLFAINKKTGIDYLNLNKYGAMKTAKLVLSQIKYSSATLKNYIDDNAYNDSSIENVIKADFVNDIINVLGYKAKNVANFSDVVKGKYYEQAFAAAKSKTILLPDNNGKIYPENTLTKSELINITKRALKCEDKIDKLNVSVFDNIENTDMVSNKEAGYIISVVDNIVNNR